MLTIFKGHIVDAPKLGQLRVTENGYLVTEDGAITGVYENLPERFCGVPVTDYGDRLILQSFCDMHLHAPQYPMVGMGMDLPLLDWLNTYTFRTEAKFSDLDYAEKMYRRLARELIDNGTTRVCMFSSLHTDATLLLMRILEDAGITGYVGKVNMDRNSAPYYQETTAESKRETLRWLDACAEFQNIRPILTPRFTPSCTDELMAWLGALAKERGLYVQSHLSENLAEIDWVKQLHPDCPQYWESYAKYGLFGDHTVMAHCVHSDVRERAAMRESGVYVAHCPDSNINLYSGFPPIRDMLDEGVRVTLGSDIAGGALLPMPQVITAAIRMSKAKRVSTNWKTPFLTVADGYYLGTTAGAAYFGAGNGFAQGDMLHAIVVDDSDFAEQTGLSVKERFERSLYMLRSDNILAVYSNGKKLK